MHIKFSLQINMLLYMHIRRSMQIKLLLYMQIRHSMQINLLLYMHFKCSFQIKLSDSKIFNAYRLHANIFNEHFPVGCKQPPSPALMSYLG